MLWVTRLLGSRVGVMLWVTVGVKGRDMLQVIVGVKGRAHALGYQTVGVKGKVSSLAGLSGSRVGICFRLPD